MSKQTVLVNLYEIVQRAVESGLRGGYNRAIKHMENPPPEWFETQCVDQQLHYVMNELCEVIDFGPWEDGR